jgi:hypothetical protein
MKNARQLCIAILFITALCGLAGGIVLIQDPTGHSLRMLTDNLRGTPFMDYSVPGWILLIAIGGFSALAAIVSLTHHKSYPYLMMTEGAILFIWILIQIEMIRELNFLQFVFALFGVALFLLGNLIRRSKRHGSGPSQHFKSKQQHY